MKENNKKLFFTAMGASLFFGLLAHIFGITNMLQSSDSITAIWGTGAGLSSGRWTLEIFNNFLCKYWPIWNLGCFNNLLALVFIGISAYLVLDIFNIEDLLLGGMLTGIMVCFPAVNATFLYGFAAVHYGAAVLMTVAGVWLTERYKWGFIPAVILSAIAMGIYQAYFPLMIILFLALLIVRALDGRSEGWNLLKRAFFYLGVLLLSLGTYFAVLKIMLSATSTELSGYQDISNMGKFSVGEIPYRLVVTYTDFIKILSDSNNPAMGTALVMLLSNVLGIFGLFSIAFIAVKNRKKLSLQNKLLLALFVLIYPLGLYSIKLMCFYSDIHEVMIYSLSMIYLLPVVLCFKLKNILVTERQKKCYKGLRIAVAACLCLICINYSMQSNAVYSKVYFDRVQTQTYWSGLLSRAQGCEGYEPGMEWAFIGEPQENVMINPWKQVPYTNIGSKGYDVSQYEYYLKVQLGYQLEFADEEKTADILNEPETEALGCYPAWDSIKVIDNVLVIKFS